MKADPKRLIADHKWAQQLESSQHGVVFDSIVRFDQARESWRKSFGFNLAATFNPRMRDALDQFSQIVRSGDPAEKKMADIARWEEVYGGVVDKFSLEMSVAFVKIARGGLGRLNEAEKELARAEEALEKAIQDAA